MTVEIVNFGCRLNTYEGEVIREQAAAAGLEAAFIFNSCAVTAEAERQVRQAIRKCRKENPGAKIIVTGCSAQVHPDDYKNMAEVDHVLGNADKLKPDAYGQFARNEEKTVVNDIMSVRETAGHLVAGFEGRARGFLQVQNGCDHRCTFCIIPFGRGPSRSVPLGDVVAQAKTLVEHGYNELVLTGVDISDYGKDLPGTPTLGGMMKRLLKMVPELPRLRLSSIDAVEVDDDLYELLATEPRLMPHIHISLQAGDDMVLKRMKRRHLRHDILAFCDKVLSLRPDVVFGADIIAGFPTETDEMFENTLKLVDEAGLTWLHVFPYSARSGTPAARMPQVPKEMRKARAAKLREAGERRERAYLQSQIGKTVSVLMEKETLGRTAHFAVVECEEKHPVGSVQEVIVTDSSNSSLRAKRSNPESSGRLDCFVAKATRNDGLAA